MSRPRPRVLVAVDPPILSDILSGLLRRDGLDIVVGVDEDIVGSVGTHFTLALLSGPLPPGVTADAVAIMPDGSRQGVGVVRTREGERILPFRDPRDIVAVVDEICGVRDPGSVVDLRERRPDEARPVPSEPAVAPANGTETT